MNATYFRIFLPCQSANNLLSNNLLSVFDHSALPSLRELDLDGNPLVAQPDVARFRNLTMLRMGGHRIPRLQVRFLLALPQLEALEVAADPAFGNSVMDSDDPSLIPRGRVLPLHTLDVRNVILPKAFAADALDKTPLSLRTLALGWPGMTGVIICF